MDTIPVFKGDWLELRKGGNRHICFFASGVICLLRLFSRMAFIRIQSIGQGNNRVLANLGTISHVPCPVRIRTPPCRDIDQTRFEKQSKNRRIRLNCQDSASAPPVRDSRSQKDRGVRSPRKTVKTPDLESPEGRQESLNPRTASRIGFLLRSDTVVHFSRVYE